MAVLRGDPVVRGIHLVEIDCYPREASERTFGPPVPLMTPALRQDDRAENVTVSFTTA